MNFAFLVLVLFSPTTLFAESDAHAAAKPISIALSDLNRLIEEKNENIKASRAMVESSRKRTGHLTRSFLPQVAATAGQESMSVTDLPGRRENFWRVGAQLNVYRGGRDKLEEDVRDKQLEISRMDAGRDKIVELKKATDAYWEIVTITKLLEFRKEELQQNEENIRSAAKRAGAGVATSADKYQFELNKAEIEQSMEQLALDLDFAKNKLSVTLGIDSHAELILSDTFPAITSQLPKPVDIGQRLQVQAMRAREDADLARSRSYGRWWHPNLDLYASYGVPSLEDEYDRAVRGDRETVTGVRLSFDFGQGLRDQSEASAKALEAKAQQYRTSYAVRETASEEHELEHHMLKAVDLIAKTEKNLTKARSFLSLTKSEYQRGIKNGPDLMGASRQLFELYERKLLLTRQYLEHRAALAVINARADVGD